MLRPERAVKDTAWIFIIDTAVSRRISITMSFVFFPIDVVFLDKNRQVIALKRHLKPWSFYDPKIKCCFFIELADRSIASHKIKIGDVFDFEL